MASTTQLPSEGRDSGLPAWLAAMRPEHWIKNLLLFVALPFGGRLADPGSYLRCALGFAAFCLLSSSMYLINDVRDRAVDAGHPVKRLRPVASGALGVSAALLEALVLLAAGLAVCVPAGLGLLACGGLYVGLSLAYTGWLKQRAIIDVVVLSLGFVLRAMASAVAVGVPASAYLVLCTFMLCLFVALAKRRSEVADLGSAGAPGARRVSAFYTPERTEHMLSVAAGLSIVTYALYCVAPATHARFGSLHLVWTVPLVVYAMFRYYCLTGRAGQQDPVQVILRDRVLWLVAALWVLQVMLTIRYGPLVKDLLI